MMLASAVSQSLCLNGVRVVSADFDGLRTLQRHQLVYRSLGELMQTDIHALSITALTPDEAR